MAKDREVSQARRRVGGVLLLLLIVALLFVVLAPPEPASVAPKPAAPVRPEPVARVVVEAEPEAEPRAAAPEAAEIDGEPAEEAPEWQSQGHDAPPCGLRDRPPAGVPADLPCVTGASVALCSAEAAPIAVGDLDRVVAQAEAVVGVARRTTLVVVLHDAESWEALASKGRVPAGVSGLYNGAVHIQPQSASKRIETARHEIFHAVLDQAVQCVPRSVHEGLASWFAGEARENAWVDSLAFGFWSPEALERAVGRGAAPRERAVAYGQAEARVLRAVGQSGEASVAHWIAWLGLEDRSDPVAAWDALDEPTEAALSDTVSELLFGAPFDRGSFAARTRGDDLCTHASADWLELGAAAILRKCGRPAEPDPEPE